ncbi:MAG TPA: hypothetical protein PKD61_14695 [Polyangiaceae bacterium]|nr:hypothetical protein [Polyangiaceae bacterium]
MLRSEAWAFVMLVVWIIACSSEDGRPSPLGSGGSGGVSGTGGQNACWSKPSWDSCFYCCLSDNPDGNDVWFDALVDCSCQPKYCATACEKTLCAQPRDYSNDGACMDCLTDQLKTGTECDLASEKACNADPACAAASACQDGCRP